MSGDTLEDVANKVSLDLRTWTGPAMDVLPHLDEGDEPFFSLGDDRTQVPATPSAVKQLATFVGLPPKTALEFRDKGPELQQLAFSTYLNELPHEVTIRYNDDGIHELWKASLQRIPVERLVAIASRVISPLAPVVEWEITPEEFYLDVVAPEDHDFGRGGDRAVGDITAGGLVITQNRKTNLAPQVSTKLFRLACTNGYENADSGGKVDSRGATAEQILADFEVLAERAFSEVEGQIDSFYRTREEGIEGDATQVMLRLADERNLPDRTASALARRVPEMVNALGDGESLSMFNFINEITNFANQGDLTAHRNVRRTLYRAGGSLISEHHDRCRTCSQRLN
jgi:hypothetical protein